MDASIAKNRWKVFAAILVLCGLLALTTVWGGLLVARAFSPILAEALSFGAYAGDETAR